MRRYIKTLIINILVGVFFFACIQKDNQKNVANQKHEKAILERIKVRECWIRIDFLEYINKRFPNTGVVYDPLPVLFLNSLSSAEIQCFNEFCSYSIEKNGNDYYFIDYDSIIYNIELVNADTLFLNNKIYVSNENWNESYFLNKLKGDAFKKNYENELNRVFKSIDTILLDYISYLNIYIIENKKGCQSSENCNSYILEFHKDSISVYDFPNKNMPLYDDWRKGTELVHRWSKN